MFVIFDFVKNGFDIFIGFLHLHTMTNWYWSKFITIVQQNTFKTSFKTLYKQSPFWRSIGSSHCCKESIYVVTKQQVFFHFKRIQWSLFPCNDRNRPLFQESTGSFLLVVFLAVQQKISEDQVPSLIIQLCLSEQFWLITLTEADKLFASVTLLTWRC